MEQEHAEESPYEPRHFKIAPGIGLVNMLSFLVTAHGSEV